MLRQQLIENEVDLPVLGEKDKDDILNFGIPNGVDYIAASFVQSGSDVRVLAFLLEHLSIRYDDD